MASAAFVAAPFRSIRFMGDSFANEVASLNVADALHAFHN
jgi:hypothetical protein